MQKFITKTFLFLLCLGIVLSQDIPVEPLEPEEEITTTTEKISTTTEKVLPTTKETTTETSVEVTEPETSTKCSTSVPFCFYYKSISKTVLFDKC